MISDKYNIIPVFLAALLHFLMLAGMVFVYDFSRPARPAVPLAITATLVTEDELREPPPAEEPVVIEADPEPEPEPQPDPAEELRRKAEEQKRQEDLRIEQQRIRAEEEADRQRQRQAAEERRKREDAEIERRRQEAERRRVEDLERQQAENERLRREAERAERRSRAEQELADEELRLASLTASDEQRWAFAIQQKVTRNWIRPGSTIENLECIVDVRQLPGGEVVNVTIVSCNGDAAVRRSIEAAVYKASPLPAPDNPRIFQRNLQFIFKPEQ